MEKPATLRGVKNIVDGFDRLAFWVGNHVRLAVAVFGGVAVALLALIVFSGGDDSPKIPKTAAAIVESTPISNADVAHWQAVYSKTRAGTTKPTAAQARKAAFAVLVGAAWVEKEAKRDNVKITNAQVTTAVNALVAQYKGSTKKQVLAALGSTEADLRFQERISLLANALQNKIAKAVPTAKADAIEAAYKAEPARWQRPSERDVRAILAQNPTAAKAAITALNSGTAFATVSKKYTTSAQLSQSGGALTKLRPGQNEASFEKALFSAPLGKLTGPVTLAGGGSLIFKVQKITPLPAQTLKQATTKIRNELDGIARTKAVDKFLAELHKRWKAKTKCVASVKDSQYCT